MRKETLEAYKQAYLLPAKLSNRKAVYLSKETQERADLIVRRLGDRGSNLFKFRGEPRPQSFGGIPRGYREVEKAISTKKERGLFLERSSLFLETLDSSPKEIKP